MHFGEKKREKSPFGEKKRENTPFTGKKREGHTFWRGIFSLCPSLSLPVENITNFFFNYLFLLYFHMYRFL